MFENFAAFVLDTIKRYHKQFLKDRILRTPEEVVANTNEDNLASAVVVGEIYDNFGYDTKLIDGVPHWSPRGADTWSPFSGNFKVTVITQTSAYHQVSGVNFYIYQSIELQIKKGEIISQKVSVSQNSNQSFTHLTLRETTIKSYEINKI